MGDLDHNTSGELLKLRQERQAKQDALQNTLTAQAAPVDPNISSPAVIPTEPPKTEAVLPVDGNPPVAPPAEPTKEEPLTSTPAEEPVQPSWDADDKVTTPPEAVETKIDFKKLGSALELEVNNETELVQVVKEKLAKAKQLETERESVLQGIPENLKDAIEVAKKGGDWQSLVSGTIDVSTLNPIDVFEREYERNNIQRFKKADGSIDEDAFYAELDAIPEAMQRLQGTVVIQQIAQIQNSQKAAVIAKVQQQQAEFSRKLSEATRDLSKALPKETFGITFEPKHSEYLYNGIANQSLVKKHLGDVPAEVIAKMDPTKLTKLIALAEYGDKISKYQYSQGQVAAKKELLQKTQNVQIPTGGLPAAPEQTEGEKPKTSTQKLKEHFQKTVQQGSL